MKVKEEKLEFKIDLNQGFARMSLMLKSPLGYVFSRMERKGSMAVIYYVKETRPK